MSSLTAPVTLLNAVTASGASKAVQADAGQPAFLQVAGITTATVALQGSLDGTTYATIGTALTAFFLLTEDSFLLLQEDGGRLVESYG